jgi:hypothetical protein
LAFDACLASFRRELFTNEWEESEMNAIMNHVGRGIGILTMALTISCLTPSAKADEIFNSGKPGGPFGFIGYDIFTGQSVAVGFTPTQNYFLDEVGVWIMSNDTAPGATFTLALRPNDGDGDPTVPSDTIIESWDISAKAAGWDPKLERRRSRLRPMLLAGHTYWLTAESNEPAGFNPVWVWGDSSDPTPVAIIDFASSPEWQGGIVTGSAPGATVRATKRGN